MRSEFGFLKHLKDHFNLSQIGDDCAVLPKDTKSDLLITSDLIVEDIDFRLEWTTPKLLGHKALAVSLSDVAAMGGIPRYSLLSIGMPIGLWDSGFGEAFYEGYLEYAQSFDRPDSTRSVELIGGDISRTGSKLYIDSTVIGEVPKGRAVLRSGAKPGDLICVTGTLGIAAFGLGLLESGRRLPAAPDPGDSAQTLNTAAIMRQLRGKACNGAKYRDVANAMIDLSDGLSSDLRHICEASGVGARIFSDKIPLIGPGPVVGLTRNDLLELALHGGEDFELLLTVPKDKAAVLAGFPFEPIGEITATAGRVELIRDGSTENLNPEGFMHFR